MRPWVLRKDDQAPDGRRSSWQIALDNSLASSPLVWCTGLVAGLAWLAMQDGVPTESVRQIGKFAFGAMVLAIFYAVVSKDRPLFRHLALVITASIVGAVFFVLLLQPPSLWALRFMPIGLDHSAYVVTGEGESGSEIAVTVGADCSSPLVLHRGAIERGRFMALIDNDWVHPSIDLSIRLVPPHGGNPTCRRLATVPARFADGTLSAGVALGPDVEFANVD